MVATEFFDAIFVQGFRNLPSDVPNGCFWLEKSGSNKKLRIKFNPELDPTKVVEPFDKKNGGICKSGSKNIFGIFPSNAKYTTASQKKTLILAKLFLS